MMYSIVIPYYNHERFLPSLFASMEIEALLIGEVVIVDDGSICCGLDRFLKSYKGNLKAKINLFRQLNSGTSSAINKGISLCRFDNISILNSDDCFYPNKLSRCQQVFNITGSEFVVGGIQFIDKGGNAIALCEETKWYTVGCNAFEAYNNKGCALIQENIAATSSNFVFRKSLFERIGPFKNYRYANDLDFILRAFIDGACYFDLGILHTKYRYHGHNTIKENLEATTCEVSLIAKSYRKYFESCGQDVMNELFFAAKIRGIDLG